jgi:NADPH2:quinone reductase
VRGIQITQFGGPETLVVSELPDPVAGAGEEVCDVLAAGVNYADTHQIEDSYLAKQSLPMIPGGEVVIRAADGRRRVGLLAGGGYAQKVAVAPQRMFAIPDQVSDAQALTTLVQGATAWHLLRTSAHLQKGDSVVVHAGAGGVGTIAIQLARRWGAGRIIASASSDAKRAMALELGADVVVDSTAEDLSEVLRAANDGNRVDVVLEMTGGKVFDRSLAALAPFGRLVVFGMASRTPPTPIQPAQLMGRSQAVIGFWFVHIVQRPPLLIAAVTDLMSMIADGSLRPVIGATYPLEGAADAHRALLDRSSVGKLVLNPQA